MTSPAVRMGTPGGWLPWACVVAVLVSLAGCASKPGEAGATAAGADIMTASDEPESRRRARIRMELAVGYFEQGQTNVALDELKQVIAIDPAFPEAYNLRGLIYMRLNEPRQAEDSFKRAVALNPRDANTQHNLAWLMCQQGRYDEAGRTFELVMANPLYGDRAKTLMAQGLCEARAGRKAEAERSLARSYELDAGNPITGYNLASLLYQRGELPRAQFLIRRINNSDLANAETLWLGIRVENRLNDRVAMTQLADQLKRRYPQSREIKAYEQGAFND